MQTQTFTSGRLYVRQFRIRLDELGLPYTEHKSLVDSVFVVKTYTPEQRAALTVFKRELSAFVRKLALLDLLDEIEEVQKKNRFRRLTFRKPLPLPTLPR